MGRAGKAPRLARCAIDDRASPRDHQAPCPADLSHGAVRLPPVLYRDRAALYAGDRKSTRLNSSHLVISYAVFCLKKKNKKDNTRMNTRIVYVLLAETDSTCAR